MDHQKPMKDVMDVYHQGEVVNQKPRNSLPHDFYKENTPEISSITLQDKNHRLPCALVGEGSTAEIFLYDEKYVLLVIGFYKKMEITRICHA